LLSACAVRGPVAERESRLVWQQRQVSLLALSDWGVDGRAAIDDGRSSAKVSLRWEQQEQQFDMRLMSFFGQQLARLQGDNGGVVILSQPGQPQQQADSAVLLMQQVLGWSLPLDGLRFWVVGVPVPGRAADWGVDGQGQLEWLEQDGWRVEFAGYQAASGLTLPHKLSLYNGALRARLVLDHWRVTEPAVSGGLTSSLSGAL
jgi:outer membrane lipoprotein LolB